MPEMEKENLIDSGNGPQSPSLAHQTDSGQKATQLASSLPEMSNTEDSDSQKNESSVSPRGNHKIDRFLSPSPISRSFDGRAVESEEEASRSTEDSQMEWNRERAIRPQTAPLLEGDHLKREQLMDANVMRTKSVPLSFSKTDEPNLSITDRTLESSKENMNESYEKALAWHPHVYAKPPKQPTPHSINDILGLSRTRLDSGSNGGGEFYKETITRQSFHRMGSSMSMSESSDSEEQFRSGGGGDQPLNLCLSKSRTSSPAADERRQAKSSRKGE